MKEHWSIDPSIVFLNHGSFGATPRSVQALQSDLRARIERNPMQFFLRDLEGMLDETRAALGAFVSASPNDLVFVPNATTGVNAVLRSLRFEPGDELLTTDHEYNACKNVLEFAAARDGARVVVAKVPFPLASEDEVVSAIAAATTARTRILLVDHVTSPTGLVFPIARIAAAMAERGVEVLVDGAHAPGMIDLSIASLAPHVSYYTANCHKWLCTPKGAAFLWVRKDKQAKIRPHVISHGANTARADRSRFVLEFDWPGTTDPTPALCIPASIDFLRGLAPDFRARNRALALEARKILCDALGVPLPAPESMIGSLAAVPLPDGSASARDALAMDPLQAALFEKHRIEVPITTWPAPPKRLVRISAQLYNTRNEYELLARALGALV
ncbi:MAG TPA: aminotransferase class V-fold PLP-dependent enzyme [Polyangiaceae bacterium]|jgi:isopenicillin-N epimerase